MREEGWEERGLKAHSKNSDIFICPYDLGTLFRRTVPQGVHAHFATSDIS